MTVKSPQGEGGIFMKKAIKKAVSLALVATMALSMAACGNKNTGDANVSGSTSGAATIKIGGIGPTTGGAAIYGNAVKNAAELAIKEINAAGGINGAQLELNFQDDEADSEKGVNAYNTLKDWGMDIVLGSVTSGSCIAVAPKSAEDNIFQITPSGSAVDCVAYDNAFQVCFTDPNQGVGAAQYIGEHKMASKVAVIYDSSDVYSTGIYEKFAGEAANQSFDIVATESFTADNKTDFSVQLQNAKAAGAELVFLPIYYSEAALILNQAASMGYAPTFFGCDGLDGILGVENFDTKLAEGVILLTPFAADAKDEKTQKFVADYKAAYGEIPNQFAADAYDAVYIIKTAMEKSGATADDSASALCDKLKAAMTEITYDGLTGADMTWAATGEVNKAPKAMKIVNGEYALIQ